MRADNGAKRLVVMALRVLVALAALGLLASLGVHVAALLGKSVPLRGEYFFFGLFVVFLPAILAANYLSREYKQRDFWRAALRGAPQWMRYAVYGFFAYTLVNFILFTSVARGKEPSELPPGSEVRALSGHVMAFYAAAMGILYSALNVLRSDPAKRCPLGHVVSPSARYCEQCGNSVEVAE